MITLREDQAILKDKIYGDWNAGARNVLGVLSTGGGKSVIATDIILDGCSTNMNQVVIAHRNELVGQMSSHVANRGIPHNVIAANATISDIRAEHRSTYGKSFVNPSARVHVISVDTLIARQNKYKSWAYQIDRWIIDEAHHVLQSNKWGKAVAMFTNAHGLGLTATPLRADGQGLGSDNDGVFDTLQEGIGMRQLMEIGALSDYEIVCPKSDLEVDEGKIAAGGDWSKQVLKQAAKKSKIVGDAVKTYLKYSPGRKAIVFATDIETAGEMAADFVAHGIKAVSLSSKTPRVVRTKYIREYRDNKIDVLINVDLFDEGFDVPACDIIIMARPTASLGKYRQMVGRGLRYVPDKLALIIDLVSNVTRHGLPCKNIPWTLDRATKRGKQQRDPDEIELKSCEECTKPYEKFYTACPYCGHIPELPEPQKRTLIQVEGDLILLDKAILDKMRQDTELETPTSMGDRVAAVAGTIAGKAAVNRQTEKFEAQNELKEVIAIWAGQQRAEGFKDREIHKKFYLTLGQDVLSALSKDHGRKDYEKFTTIIKGWIK